MNNIMIRLVSIPIGSTRRNLDGQLWKKKSTPGSQPWTVCTGSSEHERHWRQVGQSLQSPEETVLFVEMLLETIREHDKIIKVYQMAIPVLVTVDE